MSDTDVETPATNLPQVSSFLKTVLLPKFLKSREYVSLELYLREVSQTPHPICQLPNHWHPTLIHTHLRWKISVWAHIS